ncbi:MAG: hypothetical protein COA88_11130 [Kordia sp.]|nr:MAG: hypothetical protein COA88_11130 [Kordia sp.]
MKKITILIFISFCIACNYSNKENTYDFETNFEKTNGIETATYQDVISFYKALANTYSEIKIESVGNTDSGKPLHIVWYSASGNFNQTNKNTILINNGIHPGESDGIDATMMLLRDLANGVIPAPENTIIAAIPIYNIGGSLNRNTSTRTNQNGPKEYGFRGNARNYDLNRDFIKCDTKNAKTFVDIFHKIQPELFIDNHVSNGADYQYTLAHLFTQHNKLNGPLGDYLHKKLIPELENSLHEKKIIITPYVNVWGTTPETGWSQFMDYPRYSTGYTSLFNTLGMMVETHMLKPYKDRVEQTYELMESMIRITDNKVTEIKKLKTKQKKHFLDNKEYAIDWAIDSSQTTTLNFKGYKGAYINSKVTDQKRLFYDKSKPYTKEITYYNYVKPKKTITTPLAYIIPQQWHKVIELLKLNQVSLQQIKNDTIIEVNSYRINTYETRKTPYEGHYQHYNTQIDSAIKKTGFRKGDFIAKLTSENIRYLIETLEPEAPDSFFNWNFFDTILQQKEHFSSYVFEDKALEILNNNPSLKSEFERKKESDSTFLRDGHLQLDWIHKRSEHYETSHLQYPIYRIMNTL